MQERFSIIAKCIVTAAASANTTILALTLIGVWLAWGPFVGWSDTWQLVANTVTTLVTNILAFLILHEQEIDAKAIHIKLDEIISSIEKAENSYIGIENLTSNQIRSLKEQIEQRERDGKNPSLSKEDIGEL